MLLGIGCGLWAMNDLTGKRNRRREPALDGGTSGRTAPEWRSSHAAAIGLSALRLLGGYVLLSAMMAGLVVYLNIRTSGPPPPYFGVLSALVGGGAQAGMVVFAAFATARRRRRRVAHAHARLPRGFVLLISAVALPGLGVAEYLFFFGDVMVRLHLTEKVADLLIGSQWAAVLMGACWALRALASLVNRAVTSRRASRRPAPPEGTNLAPI